MPSPLKMPINVQLLLATYFATLQSSTVCHLYTGSPGAGNATTLAALKAAEVTSATWYTPATVTWLANPVNDPTTSNQLDLNAQVINMEYNSGSGSDPSVTVTGMYIEGVSSLLVGYADLATPVTLSRAYDSIQVEPQMVIPPLAS